MVSQLRRLIKPPDRRKAALKRLDDLANLDGAGLADKAVTASRPAGRADEAGLPQDRQELVQVLPGDVAPVRNVGRLLRTIVVIIRQFNKRTKAVVAPRGHPHFLSSVGSQ